MAEPKMPIDMPRSSFTTTMAPSYARRDSTAPRSTTNPSATIAPFRTSTSASYDVKPPSTSMSTGAFSSFSAATIDEQQMRAEAEAAAASLGSFLNQPDTDEPDDAAF